MLGPPYQTPLQMLFVYAGTVAGDHEDIVDGFVWSSDLGGIQASWEGVDPESHVEEYQVAVGTTPGRQQVLLKYFLCTF